MLLFLFVTHIVLYEYCFIYPIMIFLVWSIFKVEFLHVLVMLIYLLLPCSLKVRVLIFHLEFQGSSLLDFLPLIFIFFYFVKMMFPMAVDATFLIVWFSHIIVDATFPLIFLCIFFYFSLHLYNAGFNLIIIGLLRRANTILCRTKQSAST